MPPLVVAAAASALLLMAVAATSAARPLAVAILGEQLPMPITQVAAAIVVHGIPDEGTPIDDEARLVADERDALRWFAFWRGAGPAPSRLRDADPSDIVVCIEREGDGILASIRLRADGEPLGTLRIAEGGDTARWVASEDGMRTRPDGRLTPDAAEVRQAVRWVRRWRRRTMSLMPGDEPEPLEVTATAEPDGSWTVRTVTARTANSERGSTYRIDTDGVVGLNGCWASHRCGMRCRLRASPDDAPVTPTAIN